MYRGVKVQEYVLFLEYFKLIVNCSCAQKKKQETKIDISPAYCQMRNGTKRNGIIKVLIAERELLNCGAKIT